MNVLKLNIKLGIPDILGTKDMSVSITVLEIQHVGAYIDSGKAFLTAGETIIHFVMKATHFA